MLGLFFTLRLFGVVVHERIERCICGDQSRIGHHPARVFDQPLLLALCHDPAEHGLEHLFAKTVADSRERRVVRHVVGE